MTVSDVDYEPLSVSMGGVVPRMESVALTANNDARKLVRAGDYVINSRSDRKGSGGIASTDGSVSVISTVLRPTGILPQFAHHLLRSPAFQEEFYRWGSGIVADLWSTRYAPMSKITLPLPPAREQRAIADFLDRETAKIDALIEKQHALVSLLSERLDRVWAQTYLGLRAPEVAVRHVVESVIDGPFGSSLTSAHYADEGVRVIRLGNIGVNVFRDTDQAFVSQAYGQQLAAHGARPGDVVMAGLGDERMPLGRAAVVPEDLGPAIVKADCYRLRPGRRVSAGYLAWALSSPPVRSQIADLSRGATRSRLNTGLAKGVRIAVPSASEQARVERQWAAESTRHLALILKAEEFIGLAKERRAALITAAVTGQIEVLRKAS